MSIISSSVQASPCQKAAATCKSPIHNLTPKNLRLDIPIVNINCVNCAPIKYSNHQYNELLAKMAARHCYSVDRNIPKETRTSHPAIPGAAIYSTRALYDKPYNVEGKASWHTPNKSPGIVIMEENQLAQIDLSTAKETLLIGFKQTENNLALAIKTEKSIILIQFQRYMLSMETIYKWLKKQAVQVEQIIFLNPVDEKHPFQDMPILRLDPFSKLGAHSDLRNPFVLAGNAGLIFVNNSETANNFYRWGETKAMETSRTSQVDKEKGKEQEMLAAMLVDSLEGLFLEYASQTGKGELTPLKLKQLYEDVLKDKAFDFLKAFFLETYDKTKDSPSHWTALFSLYLAKRGMPIIAPDIVDSDQRITILRALYYGSSRLSRFFKRLESMELNSLFFLYLTKCLRKPSNKKF